MDLVFQYVILIAENDALCILESLSISLMDQTDQQEKYWNQALCQSPRVMQIHGKRFKLLRVNNIDSQQRQMQTNLYLC